ncbi:MAG: hypothetical protein KatS3mg111_0548 [Pirellulaceae bacterium]|nr:MAG: hypothetical protein KatS3mg111_0548 [Pirellulaceae bacterium]
MVTDWLVVDNLFLLWIVWQVWGLPWCGVPW